jgi:thiamine-phosphate pyrophosphorylase
VSLPSPPLLLVTDRKQARLPLTDIVSEACAAGCRWISLREKDLSDQEQIALYRDLASIAHPRGARITIHGSAEIAKAAGADGVHLPGGSNAESARTHLGRDALIGMSVHHAADVEKLPAGVVDYVIAGPVYATASKPDYGPTLGAVGVAALVSASAVPVIAIGGMTPEATAEIIHAGAAGIAVMGAVMRSAAPGREIARLLTVLEECERTFGSVSRQGPKLLRY